MPRQGHPSASESDTSRRQRSNDKHWHTGRAFGRDHVRAARSNAVQSPHAVRACERPPMN
jgi:hypothetical protein